jgi:hypothetical protein
MAQRRRGDGVALIAGRQTRFAIPQNAIPQNAAVSAAPKQRRLARVAMVIGK